MNNIIPFRKNYDDFGKTKEWISSVCRKLGLNDLVIQNVIKEYQEYHSQLFTKYEAQLTLDGDLGLNQEQADAISSAHSEAVQRIFHFHYQQIAHAARIIIGILAREQLNAAR